MKVRKQYLLLFAALVWTAAGINIRRIGINAYGGYLSPINLLLSAVVFVVFQLFVFGKLVKKHTKRILAYEKRQWLLNFSM